MKQKLILFFILLLNTLHVVAQQKLEAVMGDYGRLIPKSRDVIVMPFKDGLAPFMIKGKNPEDSRYNKVGFIDTDRNIVISPQYVNCSYFNDGYALVQDSLFRVGLIDTKGKVIIPAIYQSIEKCDNGLFVLRENYKMALVNAIGDTIVPFGKYETLSYPTEHVNITSVCGTGWGFTWTLMNYYSQIQFKKYTGVKAGKKWAIIDSTGREVVPPRFNWISIFNNNYATARVGKKYGIADTTGSLVIPARYTDISIIGGGYILAFKKNKVGLLSVANKLLIPFEYDKIQKMGDHVFKVTKAGMSGLVDDQNRLIIPVAYYEISKFGNSYLVYDYQKSALFDVHGKQLTDFVPTFNGYQFPVFYLGENKGFLVYNKTDHELHHYSSLGYKHFAYAPNNYPDQDQAVIVYYQDHKQGLLDTNGVAVTPAIFDNLNMYTYPANRNYTIVKLHDKWGLVNNNTGERLLNYEYDEIKLDQFGALLRQGSKYAFFDKEFKPLTPFVYDELQVNIVNHRHYNSSNNPDYDETVAGKEYYITARMDKGWGMLAHSGKQLTAFNFDARPIFKSKTDLYVFKTGKKQGLINIDGCEVLSGVYDTIKRDDNRRRSTKFILKKDGLFGLANASGEIVCPVVYDFLERVDQSFDVDTWFAAVKKGKSGLLDSAGRVSIPCIYQRIHYYSKDRQTCLLIAKKNNHYGIIDLAGQIVKPFVYDTISVREEFRYDVVLNKKHGLLDAGLKQIIPPAYDEIQPIALNYIILLNNKYGLADYSGAVVTPFVYEEIEYVTSKYFKVKKNAKVGVIDRAGKEVYPCIYTDVRFNGDGPVETVTK